MPRTPSMSRGPRAHSGPINCFLFCFCFLGLDVRLLSAVATAYKLVSQSLTNMVRPSVLNTGLASIDVLGEVKFHCCVLLNFGP